MASSSPNVRLRSSEATRKKSGQAPGKTPARLEAGGGQLRPAPRPRGFTGRDTRVTRRRGRLRYFIGRSGRSWDDRPEAHGQALPTGSGKPARASQRHPDPQRDRLPEPGPLGTWDFLPCRNPQQLSQEFAKLFAGPCASIAPAFSSDVIWR